MEQLKGKISMALSSHGNIPGAKEGETKRNIAWSPGRTGDSGQTSAVPLAAYYQPSLTAEYDEDSPGGDFDFFSNLVTKWEAAARLPGESTRQVVVRSGENPGLGIRQVWNVFPGLGAWGSQGC